MCNPRNVYHSLIISEYTTQCNFEYNGNRLYTVDGVFVQYFRAILSSFHVFYCHLPSKVYPPAARKNCIFFP